MNHFFRIKYSLLLLLLCCSLQGMAQHGHTAQSKEEYDSLLQARITEDSLATVTANEERADGEYETEIPAFERRVVPDSLVKTLKENKQLQYQDIKPEPPKDNTWMQRFLMALFSSIGAIRVIVMLLLLAGLSFLVYWFMKSNGMSFFRKPQLIEGLTEIQEEDLQSAQEYEEKIKAAIAAGETRQAIRWWYLYTLFQLAGRELIVPGREKTNNDYLRSMRSSPYYKKFATLTLDYEYIWYGGFEVSEESFRSINQEFRDFNNTIGKAS
jgi:hypothetical protein